ncbi:hypothetical protein C8Q77DRAFT_1160360 [Trametes polyzona]|nr:hypothetical protein C8Q77DRAFT_1160360 [Trametes polyzona]
MQFFAFAKLAIVAVHVAAVAGSPSSLEARQLTCLGSDCTNDPSVCDCPDSQCTPLPGGTVSLCTSALCGPSDGLCTIASDCDACAALTGMTFTCLGPPITPMGACTPTL